jgi:hypothetical protein
MTISQLMQRLEKKSSMSTMVPIRAMAMFVFDLWILAMSMLLSDLEARSVAHSLFTIEIPSKSAPNQWATTPQHHEDPTQLHESSRHQRNMQNNIEPASPSQIWPNNLISILQRIIATSCPPQTKPIFKFNPSIKAASKNYILLKHTFGGDLQRALDTQSNSPLQYGSKFRPIETLESIFEHHPSWYRMKTVFTFGSSWPLAPLDKPE